MSVSEPFIRRPIATSLLGIALLIGTDDRAPSADLAPRKRSRSPDAKGGQPGEGQGKEGRGKRGEGDQKGQIGPAPANGQAGGAAK